MYIQSGGNDQVTLNLIAVHDGLDHKFPELYDNNSRILNGNGYSHLVDMAGKISWSKRSSYPSLPSYAEDARQCDWITAINLQRCVDYNRNRFPHMTESERETAVYCHAIEKLVYIFDNLSDCWKPYAVERHQKLLEDIENLRQKLESEK